jgi:hypothetical protein
MAKKLPVYEMQINDDELHKSGVQYVALVDDPAVQMQWQAFDNQIPVKFVADQERRLILGVLMRADFPIYRNEKNIGECYVKFSKETIDKVINKFAKLGYHNNVNLMHQSDAIAEGVYMRETFQVDESRGIMAPKGMEVEDGSWIGCYYVENQKIWDEVKAGTFKGFSVEGFFGAQFSAHEDDKELNDLLAILNSF